MQALVKKKGDWTVVTMKGRIQLEKAGAFREACMKGLEAQKVVFEMSHLQFVGSTGMTEFFQCLADMQKEKGCSIGMVGLSEDFKRFVSVSAAAQIKIFSKLEDVFNSTHLDFESLEVSDLKKDSISQELSMIEPNAQTPRSFDST